MLQDISAVVKEKGFVVKRLLSTSDLDAIKGIIDRQIRTKIKESSGLAIPKEIDVLRDYQAIESKICHSELWTKSNRMFNAEN